jgi:predicted phosphoribosyltransferase
MRHFQNRAEAGRLLAKQLGQVARGPEPLVLALPRGGVPVGYEVAKALAVPLDVFLVRKLGVPGHEELAMGAISSGGPRILNQEIVMSLGIPPAAIEAVAAREAAEIERREGIYRKGRPPLVVSGRRIALVDDGLATGATMLAAIKALRIQDPESLVAAVPVAPPSTCDRLRDAADQVICLMTPEPFWGVGHWYDDFSQTSDAEVTRLLRLQ